MKRRDFIRNSALGVVGLATAPYYIKKLTPSPDAQVNINDEEIWLPFIAAIAAGIISGVAVKLISDWIDDKNEEEEDWEHIPETVYRPVRKQVIEHIHRVERSDLRVPLYQSHLPDYVPCTAFHAANRNTEISLYNNENWHFQLKIAEPVALGTCVPMFSENYGQRDTTKYFLPHKVYQAPSSQSWQASYSHPVVIINPGSSKTEINYRKINNYEGEITVKLTGHGAPTFNKAISVNIG